MRRTSVARRYARALFSLAREQDSVDSTRTELGDFGEKLHRRHLAESAGLRPLAADGACGFR